MVLSAAYVLDLKGKILIGRNYRGDIPPSAAEAFMTTILPNCVNNSTTTATNDGSAEAANSDINDSLPVLSPVICLNGITYVYIRHNNVYLLALTRKNSNATTILLFLHKLTQVFTDYFKELEEESIKDNFVVIYELFDEMMDFGYPQTTDSKILRQYITQESHRLDLSTFIINTLNPKEQLPPDALTNAVSWRSEGIKYRKNEVFLDVIESVNLLAGSNGAVLRSEISGVIRMKVNLSGMPELRLGLNDKILFENTGRSNTMKKSVEMEDVKFHQCVRLHRFESDRTISFIPPDGEFELLSYRVGTQVKPLIWAEVAVESYSGTRLEYFIKAKSNYKRRSTASNVNIYIPVPEDAESPKFKTSYGSASYVPEKGAILWRMKSFAGGKEVMMRAQISLPTIKNEDPEKKPPIRIEFEIPYFTLSGIQVRYLKVIERSGYQALPWVRYITQNGDYQLRMPEAKIMSVGQQLG